MTDILNDLAVDGKITATGDITDGSSNKLSDKVNKNAIVTAFQGTPDNTHIASEKLTKDSLDGKIDTSAIVSAWQVTPDDSHISSEKLVKDSLDTVDSGALHKAGAEDVTGVKTFKANVNIGEVGTPRNMTMVGDLNITGNITQNGSSYETHAEQVFTTKDYITMRDGATAGLATGDYSGFQVKKYDGTNDGRLVIDNTGTARVGDVGDEQPLLTRSESGSLSNGQLFKWDSTNQKAVGVTMDNVVTDESLNPITSNAVYDMSITKLNVNNPIATGQFKLGKLTVSVPEITGYVFTLIDTVNTTADIKGRLFVSVQDNGTVNLVLEKRQASTDASISNQTIATL